MFHIRIINKGKRPWDLGCPHCNFLEWQAKKAQEKTDPAKTKEDAKPKAKKETKKAASVAKAKKKAKTEALAKGDGLVTVPGIGPKTLEKLALAGINNKEDLLRAGVKILAEKTGISPKKITDWRRAARAES